MWGGGINGGSALPLMLWGGRERFILGIENTVRPIQSNPVMLIFSDFSVQLKKLFHLLAVMVRNSHFPNKLRYNSHSYKSREFWNSWIRGYCSLNYYCNRKLSTCLATAVQLIYFYHLKIKNSSIPRYDVVCACVYIPESHELGAYSFHFQIRPDLFSPSWLTSGDDLKVYSQLKVDSHIPQRAHAVPLRV
jgi:hypothetical protein